MKRWTTTAAVLLCLGRSVIAAEPGAPGVQVWTTDATPSGQPAPIFAPPEAGGQDNRSCTGYFEGGMGLYILAPFFENNPAFSRSKTSSSVVNFPFGVAEPANQFATSSRQESFDPDMHAAPRLWLGYTTPSGLGARGRYWFYETSTNETLTNSTADLNASQDSSRIETPSIQGLQFSSSQWFNSGQVTADQLGFSSDLRMHVLDVEATQTVSLGCWGLLGAAGVRYANISQHYTGEMNHFVQTPSLPGPLQFTGYSNTLTSRQEFSGAGPTLAVEARRPLDWGWSLVANARGSVLFGRSCQHVQLVSTSPGYGPAPGSGELFANVPPTVNQENIDAEQNKVLPVGELELGAEWSWNLGTVHPFFQAAWVGQAWFGGGSASDAGGNFGLMGVTVTAGVDF